ncbi:MAG: hypothetical protein GXY44_05230 [Phycisphaerales bacterium]|nr:hypothetical protein [Phycisphaerales bacterium]
MSYRCHVWWGMITVLSVGASFVQAGRLEGRILRVGFPGSGREVFSQGRDFFRIGRWTPVLVELTNLDGDLFTGSLEIRQPDRDGDVIVARRANISVRDSGRFHLYIPAGFDPYGNESRFGVYVFDDEGKPANLYDPRGERISYITRDALPVGDTETRVILDISERPVNLLDRLVGDANLVRPVQVLRGSPVDLPDLVAGLDMVDIVLWDAADPSRTRDPAQLRALVEWVRQGGILVLGVGRNWELVGKSILGDLLPAKVNGTESITVVPDGWLVDFLGTPETTDPVPFNPPLTYCTVTAANLRMDADALVPLNAREEEPLAVTRRPCGRGLILMVGFDLNEFLTQVGKSTPFLHVLFDLRSQPGQVDSQSRMGWGRSTDLFTYIEQLISFQTTAGMYFLLAFLFVIVYILLATLVSWAWLKRRGLLRQAWVVFAGLAVLASGTSVLAVRAIRGIGQRVQEISIVDGRAESYDSTALCYFGLKTASHLRLHLRVPSDWSMPEHPAEPGGLLGPLAMESSPMEMMTYAVGERYHALAALGELREVPMRATLKQFESFWNGQMTGRVTANLSRADQSIYLDKSSWITNELNTDLHDCHLLVPMPNLKTGQYSRSMLVHVYPLGLLKDRERVRIGEFEAQMIANRRTQRPSDQREPAESDIYRPETLKDYQPRWLRDHVRLQDYVLHMQSQGEGRVDVTKYASALMLMTTFDELPQHEMIKENQEIGRSRGQRLDRSSLLRGNYALLLGFSTDPGPARLCWRRGEGKWRPVTPDRARVMYRIEIPITPW